MVAIALLSLSDPRAAVRAVWADDSSETGLKIGVEDSMHVTGRPCRLWLSVDGRTVNQKPDGNVTFRVLWNEETSSPLELPSTVNPDNGTASVRWVPERTGACRISAKVSSPDNKGWTRQLETSSVEVFVTSRKLHFNYWQARPEQRFVTSVMDNSKTTAAAIQWRRRGVLPLGYKSGQWHWAHGYDSPEKMAKLWTNHSR